MERVEQIKCIYAGDPGQHMTLAIPQKILGVFRIHIWLIAILEYAMEQIFCKLYVNGLVDHLDERSRRLGRTAGKMFTFVKVVY